MRRSAANISELESSLLQLYRQENYNADEIPAYQRLSRLISHAIEQGFWKPGGLIPPERFFIEHFHVSPGTVKRAMIDLVNKGILYRHRGKGTFVADTGFIREFRRHHLFLQNFDSKESKNEIKLISRMVVPPDPDINKRLLLEKDEKLIEIIRKICENNKTVAISSAYFGFSRFKKLMQILPIRFERVPLFVIIEEEFKIKAANSHELFNVAYLNKRYADMFETTAKKPVLLVKSLSFDKNSDPFEYRTSYILSARKFLFRNINY